MLVLLLLLYLFVLGVDLFVCLFGLLVCLVLLFVCCCCFVGVVVVLGEGGKPKTILSL